MPDDNGNMAQIDNQEYATRAAYATASNDKWLKLAQRFNFTISVTTS